MSESAARGICQLNQAAIQAADSQTPKSPTSDPSNATAMAPLAEMFKFFKALAENSSDTFERAAVEIGALPVFPVCSAPPPHLTYANFTDKSRLTSQSLADNAGPLRPSAVGPGPGRRVSI
jgi:hypothetical protein